MRKDKAVQLTSAERDLRLAIDRSHAARNDRGRLLGILPEAATGSDLPDATVPLGRDELAELRDSLKGMRDAVRQRDRRIEELTAERDALKAARDELLASTSWRLTAPLRGLRRMGHGG